MNWKNVFNKKQPKSLKQKATVAEETHAAICRNCNTEFQGKYCPNCGQILKEFDKPFSILIYDFMGTVFAFDARFFKTIKAVLFRPGKFSFDYMNGKRASYMKPFQFYVFISFVFFLLLNIQTKRFINLDEDRALPVVQDTLQTENIQTTLIDTPLSGNRSDSLMSNTIVTDNLEDSDKPKKKQLISLEDLEKVKAHLQKDLEKDGKSEFHKCVTQNAIKMLGYPTVFISKIYKYFSWSFFIVMPIFAFWLWLIFYKKRKYYSGHFIYSLNTHATTFLIFTLIIAIKLLFPDNESSIENYLFWLIPVYVWLGMKKYYNQSIIKTTFKFLLLSFIYALSIVFTVTLVFVISLYY